jgi:hypothetical protein
LLYVADTGNHVIRAIDLASSMVTTVAGTPATLGFAGDGEAPTSALLYRPESITRCGGDLFGGDLFIADTGNHRVRRIAAATGKISSVLGVGIGDSAGEGQPASSFPVDTPNSITCDALGNVYVTSRTAVRQLAATDAHVVDGTGRVATIPASPITTCLSGIAIVDAQTLRVADSCTGLLVDIRREHITP